MSKQPNILILMVDQLSGVFFENGPSDFIHAPNLKRLARRGVNFNQTYCASPLCAPARASFMSGLLPSNTGVYDNAAEFASSIPTFAHALRAQGYETILSGKMHFVGADQLHGFEQRLTTDIYPADFGWTPDWSNPEQRVDWWYHNLSSVTQAGTAVTSNQLEFDDDVAYQAKLALHQLARRQNEQRPFCLTVSFTHPHDPYVARQQYWDLYQNSDLPEVRVRNIPSEMLDPHSARLLRAIDAQNYDISTEHIAAARRAYFANVTYLDEKIGELLTTLGDCDMAENTLIVFTSDHGDMLGERGLWYKMSFFEGSVRVPLIFAAPWLPSKSVDAPVSALDIAPTLLAMAGVSLDAWQSDGVSLMSVITGEHPPAHSVLAEYVAEGSTAPMMMVRENEWKFTYCPCDPPQLFNLAQDKDELHNLAQDSEQQTLVENFTQTVLDQWDIDAFDAAVRRSQKNRHLVYKGLRRGRHEAWDWQPMQDASQRYMRNHLDLNTLEADSRFPRHKKHP